MTKTLTEQWKNGKLIFGKTYWCSDDEGNVAKLVLVNNDRFYEWTLGTEVTKDVKEVLAPVPSYDEYRELLDLNVYEKDRKKVMGLEDKIKQLQERLVIATKALERINDLSSDNDGINDGGIIWCALNSLKEMEGVK